jgi:hypothetical protein
VIFTVAVAFGKQVLAPAETTMLKVMGPVSAIADRGNIVTRKGKAAAATHNFSRLTISNISSFLLT